MKVNIYYGGRGIIDDPTIGVLNRIAEVLEELRVNVERYNLFEMKNTITALPQTLKEADAIILAATVEWFGMGGYMAQFLDACWQYGDKAAISNIYMFPIVMARASGEKETMMSIINAWEILGGKSCNGLAAYVEQPVDFEINPEYIDIIEKKAEEIYRTVSQKIVTLPSSNNAIKSNIVSDIVKFTPQETEQLSKYAADDTYIKKQKEDIEELAGMFKGLLEEEDKGGVERYVDILKNSFIPQRDFSSSYQFVIDDKNKSILVDIHNDQIKVEFGQSDNTDVSCRLNGAVFDKVIEGRQTFQGAFMSGGMTARGNFTNIRMLDQCFKLG